MSSQLLNQQADAVATIKKLPYKATANILFGIALLSVITRVVLKMHLHRRHFSLDDYILFFGTACLIAGSGVMWKRLDDQYIDLALQHDPSLVYSVSFERLISLLKNAMAYMDILFALLWTATFSVKLSFLAFFQKLVTEKNLRIYYYVAIVVTVIAWGAILVDPFIICPHFGLSSLECVGVPNNRSYKIMVGLGTALDSLTDAMIVSIPIMILRRARMRLQQKAAVGTFLCLSLVMIIISLVRAGKIHGPRGVPIDLVWTLFWVHVEASIAVLMASITIFRTVFNLRREERLRRERLKKPSSWFRRSRRNREVDEDSLPSLPQVPGATLAGMRTFIRENHRSTGSSVWDSSGNATQKSEEEQEIQITPAHLP